MSKPLIGIIMGSQSDLSVMKEAAEVLEELSIEYELTIVSAHRTPLRMVTYASEARKRGLKVIIAGAGGAAHLPGMVASLTSLPVVGVPVKSSNSIDGWDSVLSILQMPAGVPVATVALNGARNAGILAAQILGSSDSVIAEKLDAFKKSLEEKIEKTAKTLDSKGWKGILKTEKNFRKFLKITTLGIYPRLLSNETTRKRLVKRLSRVPRRTHEE